MLERCVKLDLDRQPTLAFGCQVRRVDLGQSADTQELMRGPSPGELTDRKVDPLMAQVAGPRQLPKQALGRRVFLPGGFVIAMLPQDRRQEESGGRAVIPQPCPSFDCRQGW